MSHIFYSSTESFKIHPEVEKTYRKRNSQVLKYTIEKFGQQNPVKVIKEDNQLFIVDGVERFKATLELQIQVLMYEIVDIKVSEINQYRLLCNVKTPKPFTEMCLEAEYVLDLVGSSQGKKRDMLGFDDFLNDNNFGRIGKDRYEMVSVLLGLDMKSSNLRKAMKVFYSEFNPHGKSKSGIIELLDQGVISINKAYRMIEKKEKLIADKEKRDEAILKIGQFNQNSEEKPYQLFNKSSLVMKEVDDNSVRLCLNSHPYLNLREYRNQDSLMHGQESTREEYIENFKKFSSEVLKKLMPGGVLVTIIGETYKNGYQGICSRVELALEEIGYKIFDVVIWEKINQQYAPHPCRFQNSYERIIVAAKPGAETFFQEVYRKGSVDDYKAQKTSNESVYMKRPNTCITNVIRTTTHRPSELRHIDPNFTHDAPAPEEIYKIFIEAYSSPGNLLMDNFVGSGTIGVGLEMGRRVIGFDVDPVSIEFCHKRFEYFLNKVPKLNLSIAA